MLKRANALRTLITQRHPTPSCGGHVPTAERTLDPARIFTESLTPGPELENSLGHQERFSPPKLNAGCGLTKETFAGLSRNKEDAPIAAVEAWKLGDSRTGSP